METNSPNGDSSAATPTPAPPFSGSPSKGQLRTKPAKGLRGTVSSVMNVLSGRSDESESETPVMRTIRMNTSQVGFIQETYTDEDGQRHVRNIGEFSRIPGEDYEVADPEASRLVETGQAQFVEAAA